MLMKSADGNNGNCCNTNEDKETTQGITDVKMQVKKKKDPLCTEQKSIAL